MNRNGGGGGAPRRPAPPPPQSTSSSSSRQSSYGSTRTVAKTSQASATKSNVNGTGKETVIVVQRKSTKKMPLLMRKLKINKKHDAASSDVQTGTSTTGSATVAANGSAAHRSESNNGSGAASNSIRRVSASSLLKYSHSRSNYREIQSRPMIIRPGSNQLGKKKSAPPRPPPPKIIKPETQSSAGPPSYDDVLRADLSAFMGEAKAPRPKPKAPTRPPSFSIQSSTSSRQNDLLIDFDAPPTSSSVNGIGGADQLPKSLLDLDIITGPSNSLITNDSRQIPRSSSYGFADPWSDVNNSVALRRGGSVPDKPGASLRGDDWLLSCLRDSAHGTFTNSNALSTVASSPPPPPLPPRPRLIHGSPVASASSARIQLFGLDDMSAGDLEASSSPSPEPPISTPPPVPPLPADDVAFNFQLETMSDDDETPPLPPRPKLCDASRPQAVALYDYAASQSDDLSFRAGDVITLVHKVNDLWLYGAIGEREGLFPKNFVNVIVPLSDGNAITQKDEIEGPRCRAVYDFVGENDGELSFGIGDVLSLKERVGNDWFRGTLNYNRGLFPVSYVEVLEDLPLSEDFSDREYCHVGVRRSASDNRTAGPLCVAVYDFNGEPGELTFNEGDEIEVTAVVNDDWLMGRKLNDGDQTTTAHQGRFPKNFVQLL